MKVWVLAGIVLIVGCAAPRRSLTILHTNDIHGHGRGLPGRGVSRKTTPSRRGYHRWAAPWALCNGERFEKLMVR